ncbi:MAG: glycosyltransferase family 4 protein [Acidobacteria bacterium]|nr:glycosyltransferase family 4 protein [Acidobacteriota bacterium]
METFLREMTLQLRARGCHHVAVFSGQPSPTAVRYFEEIGLPFDVVPDILIDGWPSLKAIDGILRRHRPEILHFSFITLLGPTPWLARLRGVKRVFFTDQTSRLSLEVQKTPTWKRALARLLQIPVTGIMCVSGINRRMGVERGVFPSNRTFVLYNGSELPPLDRFDEMRTSFRQRFNIPADALVVAALCWMIPEKGIGDLIDAAPIVLRRVPNAHFLIGGIGPAWEEFKAQARRLGLDGHITFTGLIENPLQDGVFPACDILTQPSRWQEAFGWVISEAMGFERAVVATEVGGIPEVVDHGVTGLLCPHSKPEALAETLITILVNPERREQMGKAGRQRAKAKFELSSKVAELIGYYHLPPAARVPSAAAQPVPE